jgi:hypothetical protein
MTSIIDKNSAFKLSLGLSIIKKYHAIQFTYILFRLTALLAGSIKQKSILIHQVKFREQPFYLPFNILNMTDPLLSSFCELTVPLHIFP